MHICTIIVARLYIILIIFNFTPFVLSLLHLHNQRPFLSYTHSHRQNQKSTTKIKNQPQNHPQTPQNQTHPHTDSPTETERSGSALVTDRCAWIDALLVVLGSEFLSPCLDWRSSRRAWIGVLLAVLGSEFQIGVVLGSKFQMEISDRHLNFRCKFQLGSKFQIGAVLLAQIEISESLEQRGLLERSENVGIERSFREDSRTESREWKESLLSGKRGFEIK